VEERGGRERVFPFSRKTGNATPLPLSPPFASTTCIQTLNSTTVGTPRKRLEERTKSNAPRVRAALRVPTCVAGGAASVVSGRTAWRIVC
jgi:hypothetical protein